MIKVTLTGDTIVQAIKEFIVTHKMVPQGNYSAASFQWQYGASHKVDAEGKVQYQFSLNGVTVSLELANAPPPPAQPPPTPPKPPEDMN